MEFKVLAPEDIPDIKNIQPPEWGDITIPVSYYFNSPLCFPIKLEDNGQLLGMGCAIHHQDTVWLAHIIVHPEHRNKGLGKLITQMLIDHIDGNIFKTIYLLATALGAPVYSQLGFITECNYSLYNNGATQFEIHPSIVPAKENLWGQILSLDRLASGEERSGILSEHLKDTIVFINNNVLEGFYMPTNRDGLIIASNSNAGIELMKLRLQTNPIVFLPDVNTNAEAFLKQHNFTTVKKVSRMRLGEERIWYPNFYYNRISGQLG